jgi:hypothetical protein|tara:strand:+ start:7339 stop:7557 length:219 start_codon:yes stop_codon:yes gene_type:complete
MSNYQFAVDKLKSRMESLERKHRYLDEKIQKEFDKFLEDSKLKELKLEKFKLKDKIHKLKLEIVSSEAQYET